MPGKKQRWQQAFNQLPEETKQRLVDSFKGMLDQQVYDIAKGELVTVWAADLTQATTGYIWASDVWRARQPVQPKGTMKKKERTTH